MKSILIGVAAGLSLYLAEVAYYMFT